MPSNVLELFEPITARWFEQTLGKPTPVQQEAWPAIAAGEHTLVSAPTGTGKTLSAFLVFIDRLKAQARAGTLQQELYLIYVSPLKSLAGDIRENLRRPLDGIQEETQLSVAIRTGDTTQTERRRMIKTPPHILITTPESLYLMLTSKTGRSVLCTAGTIIIDELHALIDTKRGAHLMLSIARLDKLCPQPLQRIGLSATIEPLHTAARYLAPDPVTIVAPRMHKDVKLIITSPLTEDGRRLYSSVWEKLAAMVYEHCKDTRSVIAFVEGRAYAEKLAYFVNQIAGEGFARTHHGSLSKEQRFEVEHALREGSLRLLCATSSMELGIDVGDIDQVFQIGCPRTISGTMQRLGRAGHNPNRTSIMYIFPRTDAEGLYSGLTAEVARNGGVEYSDPPRMCLDVLAQHLVSMAAGDGYQVEDVITILSRAYPFYEVTMEEVRGVLRMLAGDYEHERNLPVRPRVLYDRIHDRVEGDPYSRMLAVSAGGTIPDRGLYKVRTEEGVKLGELDEEFVYESRIGDRFLLGTFAWQISKIQKDTVIVTQTNTYRARLPFWKGDIRGRRLQTGQAFGAIFRRLTMAHEDGTIYQELCKLGLDDTAATGAQDYIARQIAVTGMLPDDRTMIAEHFRDETGNPQIMIHSIFGKQINAPLALLLQEEAKKLTGTNINFVEDDDGILLYPYEECVMPEGLLHRISPDTARAYLEAMLPATPLFNMTFRYNTAHALMMGVRKTGRQPLWVQRMRSAQMLDNLVRYENHPLIQETRRECLEDYWDLSGLEYVLNGIRSGSIRIYELFPEVPSPMSFLLRQQTEASMMYDYSPTPQGIHQATMDALESAQMLAPSPEQLELAAQRRRLPEDEKQLHSLLMMEGDIIAGELPVPIAWLETLAQQEHVLYVEPGLWIAAEHWNTYREAFENGDREARKQIVLRTLRYRGAKSISQLSERYYWTEQESLELLRSLEDQEEAVQTDGMYYHKDLYDRARRETVLSRRRQIQTQPGESYAAVLAGRLRGIGPAGVQLEEALARLSDLCFQPEYWENILLPARVNSYRAELLDTLLAQGNLFWRMEGKDSLGFHQYEDIDWDADLLSVLAEFEPQERTIYEALLKRGASFMQRLSGLLEGVSPYDSLFSLMERGLVTADSFMPVRQWMNREKLKKVTVKQRVSARAKAMTTGRWEVTHSLKELTMEEQLERAFDRMIILCRETAGGLSWGKALETLRVWEYTGRVRRGYFIEGLSGVQFIRDKEFAGIMTELEHPREEIVWMNAADPYQLWGKCLSHRQERAFMNIPGTVVALHKGEVIAVLERQGKVLKNFEPSLLTKALQAFAGDFTGRRIYSTVNRLIVKEYPPEAAASLSEAGFKRELQDYVLYRGSM